MSPILRPRWMLLLAVAALVAGTARAQFQFPTGEQLQSFKATADQAGKDEPPLAVKAVFSAAAGGQPARLFIVADIKPGWHIYSTTQAKGGPLPSKVKLPASPSYRTTAEFKASPPPTVHMYPDAYGTLPVEEHAGRVTWYAPIELSPGVDPAGLKIEGKLNAQACDANNCLPPQDFPFVATLGQAPKLADDPQTENPAPKKTVENQDSTLPTAVFSKQGTHATIRGTIEPHTVAPGGTVLVTFTAEPAENWHVYALADKVPAGPGSKPALIVFTETSGLQASSPQPDRAPIKVPASGAIQFDQWYYEGPVTWTVEMRVPADVRPGEYPIAGLIGFQTCWSESCDPPAAARFIGTVEVSNQPLNDGALLTFSNGSYTEVAKLAAARSTGANDATSAPADVVDTKPAEASAYTQPRSDTSLLGWLFLAFVGGMILNLMPCVFPVIGLKVLSFVEQSGQSRRQSLVLNLWYTVGLLGVFLALATLAVVLGVGWGNHFQKPEFSITLACVVFTFALSFLGVWEIPLPGFVGSGKAHNLAEKEGPAGAIVKGALTTVLATPCTGPFMGPALSWAVAQPAHVTYAVFTAVGLGMASPYILIGAYPQLLRFLPRPGAWMETFKQLMGFVLLGTVVWLLTSIPWAYIVPCVAMMMVLWAACWWVGRTPLTADLGAKLRAWGWAAAFAGAMGLFCFGWLVEETEHRFQRTLDTEFAKREGGADWSVFLQDREQKLQDTPKDKLPWQAFSNERLKMLTDNGYTVLVDFTAQWCLTCKVNESVAFDTADTRASLDAHGVVPLVADMTEDSPAAKKLLKQLGNHATSIPYCAIFPAGKADQPIILEGPLLKQHIIEALEQAGPSKQNNETTATAMTGR